MNPLTVLEKVFSHLSVEDLKNCRLVSKAWSMESTINLRKSISNVPIGTPNSLRGLITLTKSSPCIPFTKFNFASHFFSLPNSGKTFQDFLLVLSPDLESLTITLDKESEGLFQLKLEENLKFAKLVNVTLIGYALDKASCSKGQDVPPIFAKLLSSSPRIEALSLIMDTDCRATVKHLIQFMSTLANIKNITSLEIYVPLGDEEIHHLIKIPFHLKTLKCDFHSSSSFLQESFKAFLCAQSTSLEYLKFDNYYGNSCYTVSFPAEMAKVKTLKIDGRSELSSKEVKFLPFSYTRQFPALCKLVLGGSIQFNKCWKILFPEDTVTSLKQLKLTARFIDPVWVERIGIIFPHLEKLFFSLSQENKDLAQVVFKSFMNARELTIYFHSGTGNVDHLFTGMSEQECQMLKENLGDDDIWPDLSQHAGVGLSNLKLLKTIRFKADRLATSPISDVTVQCLLKMTNLQNVIMPSSFQISKGTLTHLSAKVNLYLI